MASLETARPHAVHLYEQFSQLDRRVRKQSTRRIDTYTDTGDPSERSRRWESCSTSSLHLAQRLCGPSRVREYYREKEKRKEKEEYEQTRARKNIRGSTGRRKKTRRKKTDQLTCQRLSPKETTTESEDSSRSLRQPLHAMAGTEELDARAGDGPSRGSGGSMEEKRRETDEDEAVLALRKANFVICIQSL